MKGNFQVRFLGGKWAARPLACLVHNSYKQLLHSKKEEIGNLKVQLNSQLSNSSKIKLQEKCLFTQA